METLPLFEPPLPPPWDERIHRQIYDGVHAGVATVDSPLPTGGLRALITEVRIDPPLAPSAGASDVRAAAETVRSLTVATVGILWTGLSQPGPASDR